MANEYEISINQSFVKDHLIRDFFEKPARYYLTFGKTSQVHEMLSKVVSEIKIANSRQVKEFSMPNVYFMRNDEGITKKGIIIELPQPFYENDFNFVLLLFVGVKYYYFVSIYDYRNRGFSICEIDKDFTLIDHKTYISSPQDFWSKTIKSRHD